MQIDCSSMLCLSLVVFRHLTLPCNDATGLNREWQEDSQEVEETVRKWKGQPRSMGTSQEWGGLLEVRSTARKWRDNRKSEVKGQPETGSEVERLGVLTTLTDLWLSRWSQYLSTEWAPCPWTNNHQWPALLIGALTYAVSHGSPSVYSQTGTPNN